MHCDIISKISYTKPGESLKSGPSNMEDPAKNFGQDPDLPNPVRSGFSNPTHGKPDPLCRPAINKKRVIRT